MSYGGSSYGGAAYAGVSGTAPEPLTEPVAIFTAQARTTTFTPSERAPRFRPNP